MRPTTRAGITLATAGLVMVPATAAHAANGYVHIQSIYNGVVLGGVIFNGYGETAEVCDDNSDGRYVHGWISWRHQPRTDRHERRRGRLRACRLLDR
jgi:hypothetical protein